MSVCREEEEGVRLCKVVEGTDFGERDGDREPDVHMYRYSGSKSSSISLSISVCWEEEGVRF